MSITTQLTDRLYCPNNCAATALVPTTRDGQSILKCLGCGARARRAST